MVSKTNEKALEDLIENRLLNDAGYQQGSSKNFDPEFAIDTAKFWQFLETTQPEELKKLADRPNWQRMILERIDRQIKKNGIVSVLKKGVAIDDAELTLYYSHPYNDLNPEIAANFEQNIFSISRQVHFSATDNAPSIDLVIFLNGLAIATLELKNPWTNQTVYHAKKQYCDRNPKEPLFNFGRCLVHFAADTDEIWMTTKLTGKNTYFLPFNQGNNHGKGNPTNPNGHKTSYLWEDVLSRTSLAHILEHFVLLEGKPKDPLPDKTLIFPRYHQRDVVNQLLTDAKTNGPGQTYLIQHSAGSGKSNSITWLAFQLIQLYQTHQSEPLFNSVIVVTDRRNLDKQLRDNIKDFSQVKNIIAHANRSEDLKNALESGKKIIISTIQKFRFIVDGIEGLGDRRFAVIIDEAHSSQSGSSADSLNTTLNQNEDEAEPEDNQDKILKVMQGRKLSKNASYFAFTATPKNTTLEKFGQRQNDGSFTPHHLYSMKQAIEEGFILDVLANYTTYKSYYEIQKSIEDNPQFDTAQAQKKLKAYVESNPKTIATKAEIMVNHFLEQVVSPKKLKGQAKGMVVTRNIKTAIRYYSEIQKLLKAKNADFRAIVAFSGKKKVDGIEHTEESLNGFPSQKIEEKFQSNDYRLLVVANKYLTGFDEPLLHTMYVDKKLQGVLAVQALSRLNRCNNKLGKNDTFILDFANSPSDIKAAFDPFYTATELSEATDVNVLHDLKESLDGLGVYEIHEINEFNQLFFDGVEADQLSPIIDTAAERFNQELELSEEDKIDFKIKAKQFVKVYAQLACLIPFHNLAWEKLHWFLKFLIPKLIVKNPQQEQLDELLNSVDLSTYGIERVTLNAAIALEESSSEIKPQNPNPRGYHEAEKEYDPLDEIIALFNQTHFAQWDATPEEQKIKLINLARNVAQNTDYQTQVVNNPDPQNSRMAIGKLIKQAVNHERRKELTLYKNYSQDPDFERALENSIIRILETALNNPEFDLFSEEAI
ncbi:type I restriction endonuclease subunit R [Oscillatoria acuminata]|uniref:Helicase, type I site-specific restriction-modification system restriction subunit n=1 Tax=Oscillatoria acuminata PCC 6304 TaxID=56110 RepID=K9TF71_9CYAN|nr:DEAD/DEAH box helicase family protein [Oscillatoria acuminata]AFY81522.1 helicase, type I site-specific restriction-modification system restriction subunit [Oscillatoria acuminata PCC 6304]